MNNPLIPRVVIIGPGLIGGSLGMALRARRLAGHVIGVGHRHESLDRAIALGAIDEGALDPQAAVRDADLVLLAAGCGLIPLHANAVIPCMKPGAILTDVGSVKGAICQAVHQVLAGHPGCGVRFVGGHPLAGSEQRGIAAARADLFTGALCILTPTLQTDPDNTAGPAVRALWESVGCRVREMPPHRHDELLAQSSHLPHVAAACLVNALHDDALEITARGFLDITRIASGDPGLWVDICLNNREPLLAALDALGDELRDVADALDAGDADSLRRILQRAKQRRDSREGETRTGAPRSS